MHKAGEDGAHSLWAISPSAAEALEVWWLQRKFLAGTRGTEHLPQQLPAELH